MKTGELPKTYNPADHEAKLYQMWEEAGVFSPENSNTEPASPAGGFRISNFSIIMPPPNANGSLHIGHAVFVTLQDLMIRYHRMKGDATLWLPGADHAGFETQVVFEKQLEKQGRSRFDFDRKTLYQMMLDFSLRNKVEMEQQLRRLGASCDWTRERFTLDPTIVQIVYETFKALYDDGLAYRAEGIVNWCPKHQTALSDLEVKYIERQDPLYYLKYGPFTIATARPETKFGDKYVVVHPADRRYQKYRVKQKFEVEWINGKITATLIKDPAIDRFFGSGAMTITPWHDKTDFAIAKKHQLTMEQIIDFDGRLKTIAGPLEGLKIKPAREAVIKILQAKGLLQKIDENYRHSVALCYKCQTPIEPQVRQQWWLNMNKKAKLKIKNEKLKKIIGPTATLKDLGVMVVQSGEVKFVTKRFEKIYRHWLSHLQDWNLSRQIVWGIQLPVWYCQGCSQTVVEVPKETIVYAVRHGQAEHNVKKILNGDPKQISNLTRLGRRQAETLAKQLAGVKFNRVIVSEMARTSQTAAIIINSKFQTSPSARRVPNSKIPVTFDKRLNDIWLGELEGQSIESVRRKTNNYQVSVGGSETINEIKKRCQAVFEDLVNQSHGQTVLVVSSEIILHCLQHAPHWADYQEAGNDHPNPGSYKRLVLTWPHTCSKCGSELKRDPDVFDTWFSSGQWPFATLLAGKSSNGYGHDARFGKRLTSDVTEQRYGPRNGQTKTDFQRFYPTTVMETGWDILFFWVARMIMLGLYKTGQAPFKYVYLHGLVRDQDRQKMSKSKGNVIDPLGVIDLYGADALRMALIFGTAAGNDVIISEDKIRGMRNFANKVWNIARFIMMNLEIPNPKPARRQGGSQIPNKFQLPNNQNIKRFDHLEFGNLDLVSNFDIRISNLKTPADQAIWRGLKQTIKTVADQIEKFRFHQAAETLYHFTWHELADQYIESAKKQLNDPLLKENTFSILVFSLSMILKLLHPFMPFLTEAIWQVLRRRALVVEPMLITARWPQKIRD